MDEVLNEDIVGISLVGIFWVGIFRGRFFQGGIWWVGIFRVAIFPGGIFLEPLKTSLSHLMHQKVYLLKTQKNFLLDASKRLLFST